MRYKNEINKSINELRTGGKCGWKCIEERYIEKRNKWFNEKGLEILDKLEGTDVEKAYHLILLKLGISENEAPVAMKSEKKIIFHSKNFCPTLEACKAIGLDTRKICKEITERPTEELIKKINPNLRFTRNYNRLRPYNIYCEEIIILE